MQVYGSIIPGGSTLARLLPGEVAAVRAEAGLSRKAQLRLKIIRWHEAHGSNVALTARHTGFARSTLYVWLKRYRAEGPRGLEDRSRRPKRVRQRTWLEVEVEAVRRLRSQYPRWGKDKLAVLLRQRGWDISVSRVGRILHSLKSKGLIREPSLKDPWIVKRRQSRPYAIRKPKGYRPVAPGDLVEVDTADIRLGPGMAFKHFTARDVVSRWDVLDAHANATARLAADFLDVMIDRFPFPIRAIQVDGGSEFKAEFEAACRQRGIALFVLPPRSPKLNGHVERAQRTHQEEFYQMLYPPDSIEELRKGLRTQEVTYNTIRPHQALGQRTPKEFYDSWLLACSKGG